MRLSPPYLLAKKATIDKVSNRDIYSLEHQVDLQRFNAEMRTWTINLCEDFIGQAVVMDSSKINETVLYTKDTIYACSCEDYFSNKCGTCIHIEAVVRLFTEYPTNKDPKVKKHFTCEGKYISYDSEDNEFVSNVPLDEMPNWVLEYHTGKSNVEKMLENLEVCGEKDKFLFSPSFYTALKLLKERKSKVYDGRIEGWIESGKINLNPFPGISLFDYQKESVKRLLSSKRAALMLSMGLGKTLCTITALENLQKNIKEKPISVLVICPSSLKKQWAREIKRFMGAESTVIENGKGFTKWMSEDHTGFSVANYELVQRFCDDLEKLKPFDVIVFDEVQKIRNKETKAWKAMKKIQTEYLFALSGTILENSYNDFISIMEIINEFEVKPRWRFVSLYYQYDGERIQTPKDIQKLRKKFHRYLVCPDASGAMKLPGMNEEIRAVSMLPQQTSVEEINASAAKKLLATAKQRSLKHFEKIMLNAYLTKARMAANDVRLIDEGSTEKSKKLELLKTLLADYIGKGNKVVIFSEWLKMLQLIEEDILKPEKYDYIIFHGGIPSKKRGSYIEEFIKNPQKQLFLSTDAGGVGVDGLQLVSHHIIHTEPPWNPARIDQRNGRLNRMLQKTLVQVDYLHSEQSIEEMVLFSSEQKRNMRKIIMGLGK